MFEGGAVCGDTQIVQRGSEGGCALLSLPAANDDGGGYFSFVIVFLFSSMTLSYGSNPSQQHHVSTPPNSR